MTTKAKRKVRKPRDINIDGWYGIAGVEVFIDETASIWIESSYGLDAKQCRKLIAWLIKAADFLEQRKGK